ARLRAVVWPPGLQLLLRSPAGAARKRSDLRAGLAETPTRAGSSQTAAFASRREVRPVPPRDRGLEVWARRSGGRRDRAAGTESLLV
ncbi:hypothetical protein P7K49_028486, partial [Saguinus oedipus]